MVGREGIHSGLDVGEILLEQRGPVGVQALLKAWMRSGLRRRALAFVLPYLLRELADDIEVPRIPSHARAALRHKRHAWLDVKADGSCALHWVVLLWAQACGAHRPTSFLAFWQAPAPLVVPYYSAEGLGHDAAT